MTFKMSLTKIAGMMLLVTPGLVLALSNPASKEWVTNQINNAFQNSQPFLTAAGWNAACSSGTPSSPTGCYGNASSTGFMRLSNSLGGYTSYADINPVNASNSVFIKAFFAGTNTPVDPNHLSVSVGSHARCALFTQSGTGINPGGVSNFIPSNGSTTGQYVPPQAVDILDFNGSATFGYNSNGLPFSLSNPLYWVCVGYNGTDGTTAATIVNATAT